MIVMPARSPVSLDGDTISIRRWLMEPGKLYLVSLVDPPYRGYGYRLEGDGTVSVFSFVDDEPARSPTW